MVAIQADVQRVFFKSKDIDVINDQAFREANVCFHNILGHIKSSGKGSTNQYPEIEPEVLKKLHSSFNLESPTGLFEKVRFDIMFQLTRRGRENLRTMVKSSFSVGVDSLEKKIVYQTKSELDKNHNINDDAFDTIGEGRIYETKLPSCPNASFEKYIQHLHPSLDALWQKPTKSVRAISGTVIVRLVKSHWV